MPFKCNLQRYTTVLSSIATDHKYNQSLFKRFEHCGYPIHMLKTQYRMHPAIREFPGAQFYAGELEVGLCTLKQVDP